MCAQLSYILVYVTLRQKCPNTEIFWSVFSHIQTEFSRKNLRIWTLFMQCYFG